MTETWHFIAILDYLLVRDKTLISALNTKVNIGFLFDVSNRLCAASNWHSR